MLKINELARLHLGVKGENLSRTIEIDMSAWAQTYPNATAEILHKRYGDQTKALTGATYDSETMLLSWTPTDYDTFYEGYGTAEIRMMEGEVVKKTKDLIVTAVCPSVIDGSGSVVASDYQAFLDSVIGYKNGAAAAKNAAEAAAEAAEAAVIHGPYIDDDTGNWFLWDEEEEAYYNTGIHAQGPPGTIENASAETIPMSLQDPTTTIKDAMDEKLDEDQGSANAGKFMKVGSDGKLTPDNVPDPTGKADKVSGATSGNFAGLDENGNLTDSGHKHSDYLTEHQDISGKLNVSEKGAANGVAELDVNGKVPASQLPSYVDDVLEYDFKDFIASEFQSWVSGKAYAIGDKAMYSEGQVPVITIYPCICIEANSDTTFDFSKWRVATFFPSNGESGKIYIDKSTNKTYRWSGTVYTPISSDLALGETASTAYRGDRGAAAYAAAVTNVETTPTTGSSNLITSGGVKAALPGIMTGATSSAAGTSGLVPAPAAGDQDKVLTGGGTWEISPGVKLLTVTLDTITNVSGSYTGTTTDARISSDMKPTRIFYGDPSVIRAKPTVTCNNGSITFACSDVVGTTTATVYVIKVIDDPTAVTSSEFDLLNNRIGDLTSLTTTEKTSAVAAINELDSDVSTLNSNLFDKATFTPSIPRITYNDLSRNNAVRSGNNVTLSAKLKVLTSESSNTYIDGGSIPRFGKTLGVGFGVWHDESADYGGVLHWANNNNIWFVKGDGTHTSMSGRTEHYIYIALNYYLLDS